jgi:hypothetical protein
MPILRRTIRLFVSSTFSDMKAERDVLHADVFPKLRQLCLRIPMKPAGYSDLKPATHSDLKAATIPI